jgi:hypothetical protein
MLFDDKPRPFKIGQRVRVRLTNGVTGRVIEYRGPLGPNGAEIYRLRLRGGRYPSYVEVREDQLEAIPSDPSPPVGQNGAPGGQTGG